jgi:pimeloyl-ACP methyl ester carboxylesterase
MPLLVIARLLFAILSWIILGAAIYLLWDWYRGDFVQDPDGILLRVREPWLLWTGLGLLAWSFLGRMVVTPLISRKDRTPTRPTRGAGRTISSASGASLYVEIMGPADGPPIVLTHGWGLDSTIWSYAKRDLAQRFRLIVWDLPGLGKSAVSRESIDLSRFAADLREVIGLAGGQPVVLVGHSIGGMTIQTLARDNPDVFGRDVAGVVLVNTTHTNPLKTMVFSRLAQALRKPLLEPVMHLTAWLQPLAWLGAWQSYLSGSAHMANRLGFGSHVTHSQLEHTTLLATRNPQGVLAKGNLAMFHWDATSALPHINVPVLVLGGDKDIVTKLDASRTIAAEIPDARLQVIEGANHMGFLERADVYNTAIADFANSVQPSTARRRLAS